MTIEKGSPSGEQAIAPAEIPSFASCAALGAHLLGAPDATTPPAFRLQAESFDRLLGRTSANVSQLRIPVDVLEVTCVVAGREERHVCIDTLVFGDHLLRGELVIVSNTGFWRGRRLAPRAHPDDGRADIVTVDAAMPIRQRVLAWHRMRWGSHVPHPHLRVEQRTAAEFAGTPHMLTIDGVRVGKANSLQIQVRPDALLLYV